MQTITMEYASLVGFLTGSLSPEVLSNEVATEVAACNTAFQAGENGYIVITDGPRFAVTRDGAKRLLQAVSDGRLSFEIANYLADCIIMSDDFDFADDVSRDAIWFVEDDSRPPTREETIGALQLLG